MAAGALGHVRNYGWDSPCNYPILISHSVSENLPVHSLEPSGEISIQLAPSV